MKFKAIFFILVFTVTKGFSQNYLNYYVDLDSASYYANLNQPIKADVCYARCLTNYKGFPDNYVTGIINYYDVHKELNYDYIKRGFECGLWKFDLKSSLKHHKIPFSRHKINKLKRKYKLRKTVKTKPLRKLLRKDQKHRRHKNWQKTQEQDSLNSLELIRLFQNNPDLFNRFKTKHFYAEMLWVLMAHQDWQKIEPIFYGLREYVAKGYLNRTTLVYFFDRNSYGHGYSFTLDTLNQKIRMEKDGNTYCDNSHYAALGEFPHYSSTLKKSIAIPTDPRISNADLNAIRKYMFLSSYELFKASNSNVIFYTDEEYCKYRKEQIEALKQKK